MPAAKPSLDIVWFKRDLRITDHAALMAACETGRPVLPLYIVEPDLWKEPDYSARQLQFHRECLTELREALGDIGMPLVIRLGEVIETLGALRQDFHISGLWSHEETGNAWTYRRDLVVKAWTKSHSIPWREFRQSGTIRRLKTRNGWAREWDRFMAQPVLPAPTALAPLTSIIPGTIPDAADLRLAPDPCRERQTGGRNAGLERLDSFLFQRGAPYRRAMSSPGPGALHCSRLSPHLALGTLSMREITQSLWTRQRAEKLAPNTRSGWKGALSSFNGRLHWRDHFTQKLEDSPSIEYRNLHRAYDGMRPDTPDATRLEAWAKGETGLPFLDACMRSLRATGWLNFRMRAMVMAIASYHFWLPWQSSGKVLARLFTDYEPGIHWPQTQMQSGTTGINTVRIYNPIKQGHDQDPDGNFTRKWVPELAALPDDALQEPWKHEAGRSLLGTRYPAPIVDVAAAARAAREAIYGVRKSHAFRQEANSIQDKHGSRKSGMPLTGQRRKPARKAGQPSPDQLPLDL